MCTFCKIYKNQYPRYFYYLPPLQTSSRIKRSSINIPCFCFRFFKNSFFPFGNYRIEQCTYIYTQFKNSINTFKKSIMQFIRPSPGSTFNCFNNKGIKHIARLRLGLSHLRDHKFKHGFLDSLNRSAVTNWILKQRAII